MKLIFLTDTHWRNEEPFFVAAQAMSKRLVEEIHKIGTEPFVLVHGGDVFHRSKETGRVNGLVTGFFRQLLNIPNCKVIYVIQGNHDIKKETGSALDCLLVYGHVIVIKKPSMIPLWHEKMAYALPYMLPFSEGDYKGASSYGELEYHEGNGSFVIRDAEDVAVTIAHIGDETSGEFFSQADLSFLPGIKCNGHIHKRVSKNYPGSAMTTRRDEADQPCYLRVFEDDLTTYKDVKIPPALNYLTVKFNEDLGQAFNDMKYKPYGSVIVDVQGHDDEAVVREWFEANKKDIPVPAFLGSVYPDEKQSDSDYTIEAEQGEQEMNIRNIFNEFCAEKSIAPSIKSRIEAML